MVGAAEAQLLVDLIDLGVEVADQLKAGVDGPAPRLRDRDPIEQLTAGDAEQIADRARVPEGDQRRVDAMLEHRAVLDQMHPKARQLTLAPDPRIGQPDLRHQERGRAPTWLV